MKLKFNCDNNKIITESGLNNYESELIKTKFYSSDTNNIQSRLCEDKSVNKDNNETTHEQIRSIFEITKIKDVYIQAHKLKIDIMSSNNEKTEIIKINPLCCENSPRNVKDGIVYFGYEEDPQKIKELDVLLKTKDEKHDDKFYGKHFQIKFNPYDLNYYLKDLGHGFGTFIKITDYIEIQNNFLLNIGENYLVFEIGSEDDEMNENYVLKELEEANKSEDFLTIKIFSGNITQNVKMFEPNKCPFTIGRTDSCAIFIEDSMLSRIHCTIDYKNNKWIIKDGYYSEEDKTFKNSTNGSWIYAYEDILINDKMTFKSNHNLFFCNFYDDD